MAKVNTALIKQALLSLQANSRQATSHVKNRAEVSGGGRKPWRQKGTGRARAGSNRSPLWAGGGITFGPDKNRHFKQHLPKKMARKALIELLNYLKDEKRLIIVKTLSLNEAKTKSAQKLLSDNGVTGKKVTLVTEKIEPELVLATRNLRGIKTVTVIDLSILDVNAGVTLVDEGSAKSLGLVKTETVKKTSAKKPVETTEEGKLQ
ncbi:MAG: 50S ribosomal protein L4 [Patescibacteria group bacterium]